MIVSSLGSASSRLLHTSLAGAILIVAFGLLTQGEARAAVGLDLLILMAAASGRAAAIQTSRLADNLASLIIGSARGLGLAGVVLSSMLATTRLTQLITNSTAALTFPIAVSSAANLGLSVRPFAPAIPVAASASFFTPMGYQTNTTLYSAGGHRFSDCSRLGMSLTILVVSLILSLTPPFWRLTGVPPGWRINDRLCLKGLGLPSPAGQGGTSSPSPLESLPFY